MSRRRAHVLAIVAVAAVSYLTKPGDLPLPTEGNTRTPPVKRRRNSFTRRRWRLRAAQPPARRRKVRLTLSLLVGALGRSAP